MESKKAFGDNRVSIEARQLLAQERRAEREKEMADQKAQRALMKSKKAI